MIIIMMINYGYDDDFNNGGDNGDNDSCNDGECNNDNDRYLGN